MNEDQPTIKDVAEASGVSTATVSRILNGQTGFSEPTRVRVLDAIARTGYTRNAIARGLVQKKTQTLGVLLPSVTSKFASQLLGGIEEAAHRRGFSAIMCNTDRNGRRTAEYLRVLSEKQVDGILFASEFLTDEYEHLIEEFHIPIVLVSTMSPRYPIPYVRTDDRQAAYAATRYLIRKGHREIGMVSGTASDPIAGRPRIEGYLSAMRDHGLEADEQRIVHGDFHFASGRAAATELLTAFPGLTAVFAASDEMAIGVMSAAWRLGIKVPEQLSVIGYDDTEDAEMAIPPLTAIRQPIAEMGSIAVEMLLEGVSDSKVLPFSITERDSVRQL